VARVLADPASDDEAGILKDEAHSSAEDVVVYTAFSAEPALLPPS
jgi:hypothetical protein